MLNNLVWEKISNSWFSFFQSFSIMSWAIIITIICKSNHVNSIFKEESYPPEKLQFMLTFRDFILHFCLWLHFFIPNYFYVLFVILVIFPILILFDYYLIRHFVLSSILFLLLFFGEFSYNMFNSLYLYDPASSVLL